MQRVFDSIFSCRHIFFACIVVAIFCASAIAQAVYEGRDVGEITIKFENAENNTEAAEDFRSLARNAVGDKYSAVKIRDAIEQLYNTNQIASLTVEADDGPANRVNLTFLIKRKTRAQRISIKIIDPQNNNFTEQELLLKLNLLEAGTPVTDEILRNNANSMLEYLRDRGYFKAEVLFDQLPLQSATDVAITFRVTTNVAAKVDSFVTDIEGIEPAKFAKSLKLKPGSVFTREKLANDIEKIKQKLRDDNLVAPELREPRVVYEPEKNEISIILSGKPGPIVDVAVDVDKDKVGRGTLKSLVPVLREGTLDYAAIIEGERRLENYYQEQGYFFADVTPVCSVDPPLTARESSAIKNDTELLCSALNSTDVNNKKVEVKYSVNLDRKLKLVGIRLKGTDQFVIDEIMTVLESKEANIFGIIPLFGYGRGYTSEKLLEADAATIASLLRELGYRNASVRATQGVSLDGENLIITFIVEQGPPTIVSSVDISGNTAFKSDEIKSLIPEIEGSNFSRAKLRNAQSKIAEFYSNAGYYDAIVRFSTETPANDQQNADEPKSIKVAFRIESEGKKVVISRILVTGNNKTTLGAIERALTFESGDLLKAADIYSSEQNLYGSDVFSRVEIKPRAESEQNNGTRSSDVIVNVTEQAPRILSYGGGYSTDFGASGFVDIRHLNLLGKLWQGGARLKVSQRQMLAQLDFLHPRFIRDGKKKFAPLTISAQYQRDSTVTRFFRSSFDKGTFGVVQRLDEKGNPIDEFGVNTSSPTLNKLSISAETNRTISIKNRSILFFKYRFEDVRLNNINSLLIKDLLIPDSRIRISGFGATFVRDTRKRCGIEYTILEVIATGEKGSPCRYNSGDPTHGDYLTAEYNVSLPVLGANIGFSKFQASYNYYRTFPQLKNTTFALRAILGVANVFSSGNRFDPIQFPDLEGILPISERFFAGGSNTLRGFDFESAGPRYVVVPQGTFRNSNGEEVFLQPFSVPFGGNGLAILNLEARVPITASIRMVPFYDGGNVFRRVSDIFKPADVPANDIFRQNMRVLWSHTVGLGVRIKTPIGGEFGIDYGYLLNPPSFLIPQVSGPPAFYRLPQGQIHFRFSQAF